jgi:hypothetical protein
VKPVDYEPEKIHLTKVDEDHYVMPHWVYQKRWFLLLDIII